MRWFRRNRDKLEARMEAFLQSPPEPPPNGGRAPAPSTGMPLVALYGIPGATVEYSDLQSWVSAVQDPAGPQHCNVRVEFADECWLLFDPEQDDLAARLVSFEGIEATLQEDREVIWVRSSLPVENIRSAAVSVLLQAHHDARASRAG